MDVDRGSNTARTPRARGLLAALAAAALALTACTSPEGESTPAAEVVDTPAAVDAASLGLIEAGSQEQDAEGGGNSGTAVGLADLAALPGSGALVEALTGAVGDGVGVDIVTASRQILGLTPHSDEAAPGEDYRDAPPVYYGDLTTGQVITTADLFTTRGVAALTAALAATEGTTQVAAADAQPSEEGEEALQASPPPDVRFSAEGDVLVVDGAHSLRVPRAATDGWLTDQGRVVRAAARSQADLASLVAQSGDLEIAVREIPLPPVGKAPPAPKPKPAPQPSTGGGGGGVDCAVESCVALTFDDGPNAQTSRLLGILADRDVKATFFMVGQSVASNPAIARAVADAGHQIGNHTWRHPDLTTLDANGVREQFTATAAAIKDATGIVPSIQRPPYGAWDETVKSVSGELGLSLILWDVDTLDWKHRDPAKTLEVVKANAHRGSIVLMHDIHATSVDAVNDVISYLQGQGHTLVTVDELMGGSTTPGGVYYSGR
ncbi:polysaccharide deacetylase family protein [Serinibacter salmoneus]|uniref:Peptidoglycan/xylan/chitin deacetylase (PgdA/CDA1 family) n=1 Tax=Serinibacter salmoneus TaxID=556530 RepID=A0A2A9D3S6_9MICO|nr:polysaccharide deacetylase family protein [Serinibacter salmoneus]PFG21314.1 peptidoglycan/xylan/chitin deacetylase (PgdA/CDA1 family) [Serinibacter salmoneus]